MQHTYRFSKKVKAIPLFACLILCGLFISACGNGGGLSKEGEIRTENGVFRPYVTQRDQGINLLQIPLDWQVREYGEGSIHITSPVNRRSEHTYKEQVVIYMREEPMLASGQKEKSATIYFEEHANRILRKIKNKSGFKMLGQGEMDINGQRVRQYTYTYIDEDTFPEGRLKATSYVMQYKNKGYEIHCTDTSEDFVVSRGLFEDIVSSIRF